MTSGEPSPWAAGSPGPPPTPYGTVGPGSYAGPWSGAGPWGSGQVSDDQLRRLPPPVVPVLPPAAASPGEQRPAVVALAVSLAVTGSLVWVCALSLVWLVALAGIQAVSPTGDEGFVFHTLNEVVQRMRDGLWLPLYGFPLASTVTGFCLLSRRPWSRIAHSAAGVAALGWGAWWLRDSLLTWVVVAVYVGTAVAVLWVRPMGRWYAARPRRTLPHGVELRG